jgi:hypothetical protein
MTRQAPDRRFVHGRDRGFAGMSGMHPIACEKATCRDSSVLELPPHLVVGQTTPQQRQQWDVIGLGDSRC